MDKTTHFFWNLRFRTADFFNRFKNHIRKYSESSVILLCHKIQNKFIKFRQAHRKAGF